MSLLNRVVDLFTWSPLEVGSPAPRLSLTADEGTWIRLTDFQSQAHLCLVFFRSMDDADTAAWLKRWDAAREPLEGLDCALYGVSTWRTDKLREHRQQLGVSFYMLYDPLAVESRGFHASGRVRPFCKPNVVLVDKQGKVAWSARGMADPAEVLAVVARLEGKPVPGAPAGAAPPEARESFNAVRNPGTMPDRASDIDSTKAEGLLRAEKSPYQLVDVRTRSEYDADHSPLAVHIPVDELPHRYQELNQTTHLIFVCQAGGRSAAAAEFMTSIGGSEIYNVVGGMSAWQGDRESN